MEHVASLRRAQRRLHVLSRRREALASKAVDAAIAPEPWGAQAEKEKIGTRLFVTEQVPGLASFQVAAIMYSGKFIKERPKVARAFMQAYVQGLKLYNARGGLKDAEIAGILAKHLKLPVEIIQATFPVYLDPSGKPRVQDLVAFQDWFHQMGWVWRMWRWIGWWISSFLE